MSTQVQTTVGRFVWHDHTSGDPAKAQEFYGALLGWSTELFKPGELDYVMIKHGDETHGGFGNAQPGAPSFWMGHVVVDDVDKSVAKAKDLGGSVLVEPDDLPDVGRFAVIQDPQGAVISLYKPEGDAPPGEGVFVWDELLTTDVDAAKEFYGEVVGWTSKEMDMGGGVTYTLLRSGDTDRAGLMARPPGVEAPPHWLTYLGTDDVDATSAKAEKLGGTVMMPPTDIPGVGRFSVVADPTGAAFGLYISKSG